MSYNIVYICSVKSFYMSFETIKWIAFVSSYLLSIVIAVCAEKVFHASSGTVWAIGWATGVLSVFILKSKKS